MIFNLLVTSHINRFLSGNYNSKLTSSIHNHHSKLTQNIVHSQNYLSFFLHFISGLAFILLFIHLKTLPEQPYSSVWQSEFVEIVEVLPNYRTAYSFFTFFLLFLLEYFASTAFSDRCLTWSEFTNALPFIILKKVFFLNISIYSPSKSSELSYFILWMINLKSLISLFTSLHHLTTSSYTKLISNLLGL